MNEIEELKKQNEAQAKRIKELESCLQEVRKITEDLLNELNNKK